MSKVLVSWNPDWADECNFPGYKVMDKEKWESFVDSVKLSDGVTWCFGTNEETEYDSAKDFLREFTVVEISDEQYKVLKDLDMLSFGSDLPEVYDEEEDYEEEDEE